MDILTALHSRRSVRSYNSQKVTEEELKTILAAGMTAPSAGNAQPWHMVVVDDPALLAQVPSINPYAAMAQKSPVSVLVCGNTTLEKYPGFWVQDCAAAIQNMLLAATSRTCCWPPPVLASVRCGQASTPWRSESTNFRNCSNCPRTLFPTPCWCSGMWMTRLRPLRIKTDMMRPKFRATTPLGRAACSYAYRHGRRRHQHRCRAA